MVLSVSLWSRSLCELKINESNLSGSASTFSPASQVEMPLTLHRTAGDREGQWDAEIPCQRDLPEGHSAAFRAESIEIPSV